jgi:hypothetical protein
MDIVKEYMRPCDLIICRDVFIHLPNDMIIEALGRFRHTGKYLLSTTYDGITDNGGRMKEPRLKHSKLNLCSHPFMMGEAIGNINEDSPGKTSKLWNLQKTN